MASIDKLLDVSAIGALSKVIRCTFDARGRKSGSEPADLREVFAAELCPDHFAADAAL